MRFTIEIPDEEIHEIIIEYCKSLAKQNGWTKHKILINRIESEMDRLIAEKVMQTFDPSPITDPIIEKCAREASEKKIPGWIARRIKEMLESARLYTTKES